ncbi:MAG TPA: ABC transporter substrate-binding protein [Kofleriaceae bacterium]|nr:ABC transporter substrate-binding protein [Kofleriaceae bacterium]
MKAVNPGGWRPSRGLASLVLVGAAVAALAAGGCERKRNQSTRSGPSAGTSTGTIVIGHYGSMTGAQATFGQSTDNGIQLAVAERNAAGGVKGRKVSVKTLDTEGKAQEAGAAVTRLITQDHVVALLGEVASTLSLAGGEVAQHYKVPMITPSSTNEAVTQIGPMISRVCFVDGFQGYVSAKFAHDDLKAAKVAIFYDQANDYSIGLAKNFRSAFTGMGGTISTEQTYKAGDSDYASQLATIRDSNPDAIFLPGYYTDVASIIRQARKLGIDAKVPFLGGDGWDSAKLEELGGDAVEGSYYSNHYSHEDTRPEVQNFVAAYKAKYGAVPDALAALGYDAARVLFDAMDRAPSLDGETLAKAIAETKEFKGVTGLITMDENRNARKQAVILQIQHGQPTFVTSIAPP